MTKLKIHPRRPYGTITSTSPRTMTSTSPRTITTTSSPMSLVNGVYNPPKSMSKRTALRWSKIAPMKDRRVEKMDIKSLIQEKSFKIKEADHGKTLEQVVSAYFGLDPSTARLKIIAGEVWIKGSMHAKYADIKPKGIVCFGDILAGAFKKVPLAEKTVEKKMEMEEEIKSRVIYKDRDLLVINKSQMVTHVGSKHKDVNLEAFLDKLKSSENNEKPRLVHRLDKATTGCLVLARNRESARKLTEMFQSPSAIRKKYIAMLIPPLDKEKYPANKKWTITTGLAMVGDSKLRNEKMKLVPWNDCFTEDKVDDIQKAVTDITILKTSKLATMVALEPQTGRKHQLRAHLTSLDSFIIGDYKYGIGCTKKYSHQVSNPLAVPMHLHLAQIHIQDWYGVGKPLIVKAPLPEYFKKTITSCGFAMDTANQIFE